MFIFSMAIYAQREDVDTHLVVWEESVMRKAIDGYMEFLRDIIIESQEVEEGEEIYRHWVGEEAQLRAKKEQEYLEYLGLRGYRYADTDITPLFELPNLNDASKAMLNRMQIWEDLD